MRPITHCYTYNQTKSNMVGFLRKICGKYSSYTLLAVIQVEYSISIMQFYWINANCGFFQCLSKISTNLIVRWIDRCHHIQPIMVDFRFPTSWRIGCLIIDRDGFTFYSSDDSLIVSHDKFDTNPETVNLGKLVHLSRKFR